MWILPENHPLYFLFAPGTAGSKEVLSEHLEKSTFSFMSRSKPSPSQTWLKRWKQVEWFRRLCGQILKPSDQKSFEDMLTPLLEDTLARPLASQENEKGKMTHATSGLTSNESLKDVNPDLFFSKMLKDISVRGSYKSSPIWKKWRIKLSAEYSARKKSALHTRESGFLSWPTPTVPGDHQVGKIEEWGGSGNQFRNRPTPDTCSRGDGPSQLLRHAPTLQTEVKLWASPSSREWKGHTITDKFPEGFNKTLSNQVAGQPDPENHNTNGKSRERLWMTPEALNQTGYQVANGKKIPRLGSQVTEQWPTPHSNCMTGVGAQGREGGLNLQTKANGKLNASWVEQLMGLPVGWTRLSNVDEKSQRVDRLRLLGNGVVSQTAEKAFITLYKELMK